MNFRNIVVAFALIMAATSPSMATHSNNGECGTGHLGSQVDCSGTPDPADPTKSTSTTNAAPAPPIGSTAMGMFVIFGAAVLIFARIRKRSIKRLGN